MPATKLNESEALRCLLHGDREGARSNLLALNYAEAYLLRVACDQLSQMTAEQLRTLRRSG